jgi:hypothetical protein
VPEAEALSVPAVVEGGKEHVRGVLYPLRILGQEPWVTKADRGRAGHTFRLRCS